MQFPPNPPKIGEPLRADWGRHLIDWIKASVMPRGDGSTTIVHGCTVSAKYNSGGDTYTGYFKVIKTAANKIKIVDGMDTGAATEFATACYSGLINKLSKDIPATEVTITQTGVVYLEIVPVYTDDVVTDWTCTFKNAAAMPDYEDKKAFILISRVIFADSSITDFNRENVALPLTVRGNC